MTTTLYGHNYSRPGITPTQWYGVTVWRTTRREAAQDMRRIEDAEKRLEELSGDSRNPNRIRSRHQIETRTI